MSSGNAPQARLPARQGHRFEILPATYLGKWGAGLALAGFVLVMGWSLLGRLGGVPGLALEVAGGIVALVAIFGRRERAIAVFAALVPFLFAVAFLVAELIVGRA